MAGNSNFDALLSTTLANYRSQLTDNVFNARPLTNHLMEKGRVRMLSGGTKIIEPLIYGQNSTISSYSGYDTLSLTPQAGITAAEYDWKQYAVSIAISGIEEAKNNGENEIINLLEAKIMQAEESMREGFTTMFYGDGTGNSGKDWNGLENLVDASGTVGGIDRAGVGNTFWKSTETAVGGPLTLPAMTTLYNTISVGNDHPDFAVTTQTLFEKYETMLQPQLRYSDVKTINSGFQNLMFKDVALVYDTANVATNLYMLNSKYLTLVGHSDKWFKQTEFIRPEDLDARYALIMCYGNLTCRNAKKQGKLTGATA